jgi:hypothetical protein
MNREDLNNRILEIARQRLECYPGALEVFRDKLNNDELGRDDPILRVDAKLLPLFAMADAAEGNHGKIDRQIIDLVDRWADKYQPVVAPLTKSGYIPPPAPDWQLIEPKIFKLYREPLFDFLKQAHAAGLPKPNAGDVLKAWKDNPPPGYGIQVNEKMRAMTYSGGGAESVRTANNKAINLAIGRMTSPK